MSLLRECRSVRDRALDSARRQDGSVLVWALFFVCLTSGILIAHSFEMSANRRTMDTRYRRIGVASTIAESGLTDATAYLRRQTVQPVKAFAPQCDPAADPPLNDTIDPSLGLVREFEVHGNLWGRYEVRKEEAIDVSAHYGEPSGTVWDVGARGYLYEVSDPSRPFDQAPNRVISTQTVRTEVRGLVLNLPSNSAIVVNSPASIQMLGNGDVNGNGGPAVAYRKPTGPFTLPVFDLDILGSPIGVPILNLDISLPTILGMREDKLRNLADIVVLSPRQLGERPVADQAVYVPDSLVLDQWTSLRGRMLLAIRGDFEAAAGNASNFGGVLFVQGNATIEGPFTFHGTMVVNGSLKIGGSAEDVSILAAPAEVLALQTALSQYRISREKRPAASGGAFATPEDVAVGYR